MRCSTGVPLCIQKGIKWFSQTFQNWDFPGVVRLKYKFSAENANCKWIPKSVQLMRIDQNTNCDKIKIECYIPGNVNQQDPWKVNENRFISFSKFFHVVLKTAFSIRKAICSTSFKFHFEMFNVCLCAFATVFNTSKLLYCTETTSVNWILAYICANADEKNAHVD